MPYAVGGGYDVLARVLSPYLSKYLQEVSATANDGGIIIKNEPAASGRKGRSMIKRAKPDGNTLGIMDSSTVTDNIVGDAELEHTDLTKFTFLLQAVSTNKIIASSKKGFTTWEELIYEMKKRPVKMAVGSFGRANHVSAIIMNERMGTKFKLANFLGTSGGVNAVVRGDVDVLITDEESVKELIDAGVLRPLLSMTESGDYPGVASMQQIGFPELAESCSSHRFIIAPPGLEAEPKRILLTALKKATHDAEFVAWAKKFNVHLRNIYGSDAEKMFLKYKKDYENLAPMLKKYLS